MLTQINYLLPRCHSSAAIESFYYNPHHFYNQHSSAHNSSQPLINYHNCSFYNSFKQNLNENYDYFKVSPREATETAVNYNHNNANGYQQLSLALSLSSSSSRSRSTSTSTSTSSTVSEILSPQPSSAPSSSNNIDADNEYINIKNNDQKVVQEKNENHLRKISVIMKIEDQKILKISANAIQSTISTSFLPITSSRLSSTSSASSTSSSASASDIDDEFICKWEYCYRIFLSIDDLAGHVTKTHATVCTATGLYMCKWELCSRLCRGFNARYKMLVHVRTHTKEKPHQCNQCDKSFSRAENLKIHIRSHSGEKPYVCSVIGCNKAYSNSSDRFKHTRTHSTEKPYICKILGCNKKYTDPSSLRKHVKTFKHSSSSSTEIIAIINGITSNGSSSLSKLSINVGDNQHMYRTSSSITSAELIQQSSSFSSQSSLSPSTSRTPSPPPPPPPPPPPSSVSDLSPITNYNNDQLQSNESLQYDEFSINCYDDDDDDNNNYLEFQRDNQQFINCNYVNFNGASQQQQHSNVISSSSSSSSSSFSSSMLFSLPSTLFHQQNVNMFSKLDHLKNTSTNDEMNLNKIYHSLNNNSEIFLNDTDHNERMEIDLPLDLRINNNNHHHITNQD